MPVIPVVRHILRGRIRAQVQYQLLLGERLATAYGLNRDLQIFTGLTGAGSLTDWNQCLTQMTTALTIRE